MRPQLVMLDRDGVLNEEREDFVKNPGECVPLPGSAEAVGRLTAAGIKIAIVTNQSGLARGLFDEAMLDRIHEKLRNEVARHGGHFDAIFFCPDPPWAAGPNRKPEPGMLRQAMRRFRMTPGACLMIGDSLRDLQAAAKAGCNRALVRTGNGAKTQAQGLPADVLPVSVYNDLGAAVDALLGDTAHTPV